MSDAAPNTMPEETGDVPALLRAFSHAYQCEIMSRYLDKARESGTEASAKHVSFSRWAIGRLAEGTKDPKNPLFREAFASVMCDLISDYECLVDCYNQVFIRGSLSYCSRVLSKDTADGKLIKRIVSYAMEASDLLGQHEFQANSPFRRLDLQLFEDHFELIEDEAAEANVLPRLDDLTLADSSLPGGEDARATSGV